MEFDVSQKTRFGKLVPQFLDEGFIRGTAPATDLQFEILDAISLAQEDVGSNEGVQALFFAHAGEVAQGRWSVERGVWSFGFFVTLGLGDRTRGLHIGVAGQVDAVWQNAEFLHGHRKSLAHEIAEVPAGRDKQGDVNRARGERLPTRSAGWFGQGIKEIILALKKTYDGATKFRFKSPRQPHE